VFSQFTSFLDLIEIGLKRDNFDSYRFDGTMDVKKKAAAISAFKAPSDAPKVLAISLKAGGVGLNVSHNSHNYRCVTDVGSSLHRQIMSSWYAREMLALVTNIINPYRWTAGGMLRWKTKVSVFNFMQRR